MNCLFFEFFHYKSQLLDESGNSTLHLDRPKSLAFDFEGNLYVADVGNKRVQKFIIDNSACSLPERTQRIRICILFLLIIYS